VYDKGIAKTIDISRRIKMFAIMEYVWKIRGQLKKDATSDDQSLYREHSEKVIPDIVNLGGKK
jgi:hypothetical protein